MPARVWIAGEGNNELGSQSGDGSGSTGVLEALLTKVCPTGWACGGKIRWKGIHKFRAGGARGSNHGDFHNALGLVLEAYEQAADAIAFSRDVDSDLEREDAIDAALRWLREESGWSIQVIGGVAKPALEGWILALLGARDTDNLSRSGANQQLARRGFDPKSVDEYVEVVKQAALGAHPTFGLPTGSRSLRTWLAAAHEILHRLVHGTPAP